MLTRRQFLGAVAASPLGVAIAAPRPTDVRIDAIRHCSEDFVDRARRRIDERDETEPVDHRSEHDDGY